MWWIIGYFIMWMFTAVNIATWMLRKDRAWHDKNIKYREYEPDYFGPCMMGLLCGMLWPISIFFLFFVRFVQDVDHKNGN